ncbi:MAG: hypothetical protein GY809_07310, partial [Planctomycetes bacterium]|nr:hypothetical protein [Planctomycetota bacterium]
MQKFTNVLPQTAAQMTRWGLRCWKMTSLSVLIFVLIAAFLLARLRMQEDIEVMLPDSDPAFVASYQLLKASPFTRSILIDLEAPDDGQVELLTQTAQRLSEKLPGPFVSKVVAGLPLELGPRMLDWLYAHMPQLFTEDDARILDSMIESEQVGTTLRNSLRTLSSPEGFWLKRWLGRDPLGFRNLVFRKLGTVAMLPDTQLDSGFLVDPTGR